MNQWKPYLIALAVGLLVGIERENSKSDTKAFGVRTFILISLLGAIAGGLENTSLAILIAAFSFCLISASYIIQIFSKVESIHLGLTTEYAAGIIFIAGYIAHDAPIFTAALGTLVALILFSKNTLHKFTKTLKPLELKAAITILLLAVVVIDLAPNHTIDPWNIFNPRKFGNLIVIMATLEFSSYVLLKWIGEKNSSLIVGFLGGLVSSTVVLVASARQSTKTPESWRILIGSVLIAQLASFTELAIIVLLVSQTLFMKLIPSVCAGLIFIAICMCFIWRKEIPKEIQIVARSPLDLRGVFRLSFIFTLLLAAVTVSKHWFGNDAIYTLSFLSGMFELQGISLATATFFSENHSTLNVAKNCILLAITSSIMSKIGVSWLLSRNKFSLYLTLIFIPMIAIIFLVNYFEIIL